MRSPYITVVALLLASVVLGRAGGGGAGRSSGQTVSPATSGPGPEGRVGSGGEKIELTDDGAWSWFSEPRAFWADNAVIASWVTSVGRLQAGRCDLATGVASTHTVVSGFEADDHSHPVLVRTRDGRYTAFYSIHAGAGTFLMYRVATEPNDLDSWSPERLLKTNTPGFGGATYPTLIGLHGEADTLLAIWRGGNWNPTYSMLEYDEAGALWSYTEAAPLIILPTGRPYAKYAADGRGRLGVAFTDGHPRETCNNLYYVSIDWPTGGDAWFSSADGTLLRPLGDRPLEPGEAEIVFDRGGSGEAGDNCWVWDVAFDEDGRPVVAYATFTGRGEHQYHVARHDGSCWNDHLIVADAGGSIADTTRGYNEYYYSGGVALDPLDPGTVYASVGNDLGGWDILQWRTVDAGLSWTMREITHGDTAKNVRPVVPLWRPGGIEMVLWMSGEYTYYTEYDASIMLWAHP